MQFMYSVPNSSMKKCASGYSFLARVLFDDLPSFLNQNKCYLLSLGLEQKLVHTVFLLSSKSLSFQADTFKS